MSLKYYQFICIILLVSNWGFGQIYINEIMTINESILADSDGEYDDWIEIYNASNEAIDLAGYFISDQSDNPTLWQIPATNPNLTTVPPEGFLILWADSDTEQGENHLDFKLGSSDENLILTAPDGVTEVDNISFPNLAEDISYGRVNDGALLLSTFTEPTPNASNNTSLPQLKKPIISVPSGSYNNSQSVTISSEDNAEIYYTLDGSIPTSNSNLYNGAINIANTKSIRAIAIKANFQNSFITTNTYLINEDTSLPVFHISMNPDDLYDNETGIYVSGSNGITGYCSGNTPRNWNQDWEKEAHLKVFKNGEIVAENNIGIKIGGNCKRNKPQKPLNLYFRDDYSDDGENEFTYPIFPDNELDHFKRLYIRSGNNNIAELLKDLVISRMLKNRIDLDALSGQPAIIFLNDQYIGIQNIREKYDRWHYENDFRNVKDRDKVDVIKNPGRYDVDRWWPIHRATHGDTVEWRTFINEIRQGDYSVQNNYEQIQEKIDTDELINYLTAGHFFANHDWVPNNQKVWKEQGYKKWRWCLVDFDSALSPSRVSYNTFTQKILREFAVGSIFYESNLVYRKLFENEEFKNEYIQRMNTYLELLFINDIFDATIDGYYNEILTNLPQANGLYNHTLAQYQSQIQSQKTFVAQRGANVRQHLTAHFGLSGTFELNINFNENTNGKVVLNSNYFEIPFNYQGDYFKNVPIEIHAIPNPGYRFSHWQETNDNNPHLYESFNANTTLTPVFEPALDLVINEVHYHPNDDINRKEFVEIYNPDSESRALDGYQFSEGIYFRFPRGVTIAPNEYVIIAEDAGQYEGNGYQVFEWEDSGLDKDGESLVLQTPLKETIDSIYYNDKNPWDEAPDGEGFSLELLNTSFDNNDPLNWFRSDDIGGTPGQENSTICNESLIPIVINEINYNSDNENFEAGDWVELYNPNAITVDISAWRFYDNDSIFFVPQGTTIAPNEYIVLVEDQVLFSNVFPEVAADKIIGDFPFSLSEKGERISLFENHKCLVDYVIFNDKAPWPETPDGEGPTLSLKDILLDNNLPDSWENSLELNYNAPFGSPAAPNNCTPGDSCDDGDECTVNDTLDNNCDCVGTPLEDADNDGFCDLIDQCPNFDDALIGTPCDDGDICTTGEVYDDNCNCSGGIFQDDDNDGICNAEDICPSLENTLLGQLCDDGDPLTEFDTYNENTCSCSGVLTRITICSQVAIGSDDAEEHVVNGTVSISSKDLDLVDDDGEVFITGIRFQNINVPQGAIVTNATIQFAVDEVDSDPTILTIVGENTDNANTFSTDELNISNRSITNASVTWEPNPWSTVGDRLAPQKTIDLSPIIQEIVNRPNFAQGNAIAIIISGQGIRTAESFNGSANLAPEICIEYETGLCVENYPCDDNDPTTINDRFDENCNCVGESIRIDAKVLLEGFYDHQNNNMHTILKDNNLLPFSQPYNTAPWNYSGGENVSTIPENVVDWVLLISRDSDGNILDQAAGFVHQSGRLMGIDGVFGIPINNGIGNTFSIHHRSHLAILASNNYDGSLYDFTLGENQAAGNGQLKLIDGKYMLYAGDYDGKGIINSDDFNGWKIQGAVINQYLSIDGDGNGIINSLDYNLWTNNKSKVGHPVIRY